MTADRGASILARLLTLAKRRGDDYNLLLNRFALERLLYRIAASRHADRFLVKGALLFSLWYDEPHRPTRDADLLGFGPATAEDLVATFREIAAIELDDGIAFDPESVRAAAIREEDRYGGQRVRMNARINNVRCALQIDVGYGDAVTPEAKIAVFPALLEGLGAPPSLRVYPVFTVIAEKYQAMVLLGLANTRMKDFYDVAVIAKRTALDGALLARAIAATFNRRGTPLPTEPPMALTASFGDNGQAAAVASVPEEEPHRGGSPRRNRVAPAHAALACDPSGGRRERGDSDVGPLEEALAPDVAGRYSSLSRGTTPPAAASCRPCRRTRP